MIFSLCALVLLLLSLTAATLGLIPVPWLQFTIVLAVLAGCFDLLRASYREVKTSRRSRRR
jgi:uncharacterized protein (DUF697 family)